MQENLKCDVRKLPKSAIALDITVPKAVADEIHLKTLAGLAKNAHMPGFRDGKVPPQAVIAKLGIQKVKEATVEQIVDVGMTQSGVGQRIQTVGEARLPEEMENVAKRYKVGEDLAFTVEVDIYPQVPLEGVEYKGLRVEVEAVEFNQDAYDSALKKLQKRHCDIVDQPAEVAAEEGREVNGEDQGGQEMDVEGVARTEEEAETPERLLDAAARAFSESVYASSRSTSVSPTCTSVGGRPAKAATGASSGLACGSLGEALPR